MKMNPVVESLSKWAVTVVAAVLATYGITDAALAPAIVGGFVATGTAVWGWWTNRQAAIAAKAQRIDGVNVVPTIEASPSVVHAINKEKAAGYLS